jgi:hypothetical protein
MSKRYNNGSHYENHERAAELHDLAAHVHRVAQQHHGQQDHQTATEHSRQALEHSQSAHLQTKTSVNRHGIQTFGHHETAELAHSLWQARGCPFGSQDEDWYRAKAELIARGYGH